MFMRKRLLMAALALAGMSGAALAEDIPQLGRVATPEEMSSWDIDASPDGTGLPPGSGMPKQGEAIYVAQCQSCHGVKGVGGPTIRLAGGQGTIVGSADVRPIKTIGSYWPYATSVFAYIRRSMPFYNAKSLSNDELYAVTAYLLQLNGLIGENDVMNAQTLPKVQMSNRDGFFLWKRGD
jgi:mono/diheme cytochrome c family protein